VATGTGGFAVALRREGVAGIDVRNRVAMFTGVHFANTGAAPPMRGGAADD